MPSDRNSGARLALILIEDDSRMRAQFLDVIAAEPSLRVASGASAAVDMLAWLAAKLVIALRPDSGSADRSSAAVAGRRAGTWEPSSIMEITLCADDSSMRQAFETELSGHLIGDSSEAGRSFRVMSLHAGRSATKPIVAREVLAGRKAERVAVATRRRGAGPEQVPGA